MDFNTPADKKTIDQTITALKENGIDALSVATKDAAKEKVLSLIPKNSEVFTVTSVTLEQTGIAQAINDSPDFVSVREKLNSDKLSPDAKRQLGAAPKYVIGSVHAVTQDGRVLIASNTGSQLPADAYGAEHVIWVVGTQKIVTDLEMGMKRIYDHVLPLESERAHKAYGVEGSFVSKLLIFNREPKPNRITIIFVEEILGF